jgi:hypothetical protein
MPGVPPDTLEPKHVLLKKKEILIDADLQHVLPRRRKRATIGRLGTAEHPSYLPQTWTLPSNNATTKASAIALIADRDSFDRNWTSLTSNLDTSICRNAERLKPFALRRRQP